MNLLRKNRKRRAVLRPDQAVNLLYESCSVHVYSISRRSRSQYGGNLLLSQWYNACIRSGRTRLPVKKYGGRRQTVRGSISNQSFASGRLFRNLNFVECYPRLVPYCHPLRAGSLISSSSSGWPLTSIFLLSHSMLFPVRWARAPRRTISVSGTA